MADSTTTSEQIGVQELLDAGLHFGHQTRRWNPEMKSYIFDKRNGIHIIDLAKTLKLMEEAERFLYDVVVSGRKVLFIGTKKQAQEVIQDAADELAMPYVTTRWLGGTLTNQKTIRTRVGRLDQLRTMSEDGSYDNFPKKEVVGMNREMAKLERNLGGIADMGELPGAVFVVDINREAIAVKEANRLHIPVVAIVDTNSNPKNVDYVIPGNDDAIRAIKVVVGQIGRTIARANAEWAKIAAEIARKKAEEEARKKAEDDARKKAAEEAREKAAGEEKVAAEKVKAEAKAEKAKPKPKKPAAKKADAAAEAAPVVDAEAKAAPAEEKADAPAKAKAPAKEKAEAPAKEKAKAPAKAKADAPAKKKAEKAPAEDAAADADKKED